MIDLAGHICLLEKIIKKIQSWVRYSKALNWNIVMWQPYSSHAPIWKTEPLTLFTHSSGILVADQALECIAHWSSAMVQVIPKPKIC